MICDRASLRGQSYWHMFWQDNVNEIIELNCMYSMFTKSNHIKFSVFVCFLRMRRRRKEEDIYFFKALCHSVVERLDKKCEDGPYFLIPCK